MNNHFEARPFQPEPIIVQDVLPMTKTRVFIKPLRVDGMSGDRDTGRSNRVDLEKINRLQISFDAALGRVQSSKELLHRSYNPVVDKFHLDRMRESGDKQKEEGYITEMKVNLWTNLRERLSVSQSKIRYAIEGDQLYSEHFPDKPFTQVLEDGVVYRLEHDTPEPEREGTQGELAGWEVINQKLTDPKTPVGTTMISLSPPGEAEGTAYTGQFVDTFKLTEDASGKRFVDLTRTAVDLTRDDFNKLALSSDPDYFKGYDGRPWDAWLLSHPFEADLPELREKGMTQQEFEKYIMGDPKLVRYIDYYTEIIRQDPPDWKQIALTFNTILNHADDDKEAMYAHDKGKAMQVQVYPTYEYSHEDMISDIQVKGNQPVAAIGGGGCPTNAGFSFSSSNPFTAAASGNSVARYAGLGSSEKTLKCESCPQCGELNIVAVIKDGRITHPGKGCSAPYAC
jgi:hypothetical protein